MLFLCIFFQVLADVKTLLKHTTAWVQSAVTFVIIIFIVSMVDLLTIITSAKVFSF